MEFDVSDLIAGLAAAQRTVDSGSEAGLLAAAKMVLAQAEQVVPIEDSGLESSGRAAMVGENTAAVGFGSGDSAPYAIIQHENLSLQHDAGRHGHYLSGPLIASQQRAAQTITDRIRASLG